MKRRSRKNRKLKRQKSPNFELIRHPFSGLDPKTVKDAVLTIATDKAERFPVLLEKIVGLFRKKSPIHILAVIASYGSQTAVTDQGVTTSSILKGIEQHHIELLQALALSIPSKDWGGELAMSADIQEAIDTIAELADAFHQRRYRVIEEERKPEERAFLLLQERIRLHTQAVRNWGYLGDVIAISTELYSPLDEDFHKKMGFTASDLITAGTALVSMYEERLGDRFKKLKRVFKDRKPHAMIRRYYEEYPELQGTPEDLIQVLKGASADAVAGCVLSHSDLSLLDIITFTAEDLTAVSGVPIERTLKIMQALSLSHEAFRSEEREHFFLNNPLWQAPIIAISDCFFCPLPQGIFSHIHDIMRGLAESGGLKEALAEQRASYLESKVAQLLAKALPEAAFVHRVRWQEESTEYETDHLGRIDRTVIIVEDKSAALTGPGLRGAPERVKRHLKDLVFDPSEQSARLEALIYKGQNGDAGAKAQLAPFGVDFSDVESIVRLSVTLDDFSIVASAETEIVEAGFMPAGMQLAATLNVADLQTVVDILDKPTFFLDYFMERARIQKAIHIFADEMDYLGLYLETGFNIYQAEAERQTIILTGMSGTIDRYYNSRDADITLPKPIPKLSPYFARLLKRIETRRPPRWINVGHELLRACSFEEQRKVGRLLERLKKNVMRNWRNPDHECSLIISPPETRNTIIVFHVFPSQLEQQRRATAEQLAAQVLDGSDRRRCIVISRNLDQWVDEYVSILLAGPENGVEAR